MNTLEEKSDIEFKRQLTLIEYRESVSAFFKGIDIGMAYARSFTILNGVLFAVFGINEKMTEFFKIDQRFSLVIVPLVSIVGMVLAVMLWMILPYYWQQMDACAERCVQIEKTFDGKLLTKIDENNRVRGRVITTTMAARFLALTFLAFWSSALYFFVARLWQ